MAKVPFTKLGVKYFVHAVPVQFNDQTISVMQYLPIQDKLEMIGKILEISHEQDANYANPVKVDVYTEMYILEYYTNISFTEKQKEDMPKLYDACAQSGLIAAILNTIPDSELKCIKEGVARTIKSVYSYQSSILGIMDAIGTNYQNLGADIEDMQQKLADSNNLSLLKTILEKLG